MRTIKGLLLIALLAFSSAFFIESVNVLPIEKVEAACAPGSYSPNGSGCANAGGSAKSTVQNNLVKDIVGYYNPIAGVLLGVSLLTIIYSAYKMMTASGDSQRVLQAKRLLFGSGVAIIIILSSFTIMRLLMSLIG